MICLYDFAYNTSFGNFQEVGRKKPGLSSKDQQKPISHKTVDSANLARIRCLNPLESATRAKMPVEMGAFDSNRLLKNTCCTGY